MTANEYAKKLIEAGFTVYLPVGDDRWFHYQKDGLFGTFAIDRWGEAGHTMPVHPTREFGSAIMVSTSLDPFSVECAELFASPENYGMHTGKIHKNYQPWGIGKSYKPAVVSETGEVVLP